MRLARASLTVRNAGHRDATFLLIAVEGPKDEAAYFRALMALPDGIDARRFRLRVVHPPDDASAPHHVLDAARAEIATFERRTFDATWLVMDVDRWKGGLQKIAKIAKKDGFSLAISDPCFQVWLLLHLDDTVAPGTCAELKKRWGERRNELSPGAPWTLTADQARVACDRADLLAKQHPGEGFLPGCPGTTVQALVGPLLRGG